MDLASSFLMSVDCELVIIVLSVGGEMVMR